MMIMYVKNDLKKIDIHFEPPEIPVEEMSASCELISSSLLQS